MLFLIRNRIASLLNMHRLMLCLLLTFSQLTAGAMVPSSFADLTEKVKPAVVNIASSSMQKFEKRSMQEGQINDFFDDFFKDFFGSREDTQSMKPYDRPAREVHSLGSGFLISADGYIITNNHVIESADKIEVTLDDKTTYHAQVIGRDKKFDIAVLKIKAASNLPYVTFSDSTQARVGDWVLAIGNPFGLGGTVTAGIISARGRNIRAGVYDDFIQTDASINRGSSGGPLFNMQGDVVGVNTAIYSNDGGSIGIGFAIPSSMVKYSVDQLISHGKVVRGWLGVYAQVVDKEIAESVGLDKPRGALVVKVNPNSPAEKAKLKQGDIILSFDGKNIDEMRSLPKIVAHTNVGKSVDVVVWRNGKEVTLTVKVAELDPGLEDLGEMGSMNIKPLGLTVAKLSDVYRKKYNISEDISGVVILNVTSDSILNNRGIEKGDVLVAIEQKRVETPSQVQDLIAAARKNSNRPIMLLIYTKGVVKYFAIRVK